MERVFTEDRGRYSRGEVRDYPLGTWRDFFPGYEKFTVPVEAAVATATSEPTDVVAATKVTAGRRAQQTRTLGARHG